MIKVESREEFLMEARKHLPLTPIVVEIGCYRGDFSQMLLEILNPHALYLIDAFEKGGMEYTEELNNIQSAYSNLADFDFITERFKHKKNIFIEKKFSYKAVNEFYDNTFDLIYHDSSHLYEDIKRDLNDWLPKVKLNGIVAGHDCIEFANFGVIEAVDEFCNEHNFEMIILNSNGGDFALKRI